MLKNILKIIFIFVIGMGGGIFATQIIWPHFVEESLYKYEFSDGPVYLTEKNEITVQENVALQDAVEKVEEAVVGITAKTKKGEIIMGSGLIVTSDGLIITLAELVPKGGEFTFFVDGKIPKAQVLKRDLEKNLALIKIEADGLSTVGFVDYKKLRLGERVFLLGMIQSPNEGWMVNQGIVKFFTKNYIHTNIFEKTILNGSSLFNINGELLGLNTIDSEGKVTAISITEIRDFIGF